MLGPAVLVVEVPEQLVLAVREGHVLGALVAGAVEDEAALLDRGALVLVVVGPGLDVPRDLLGTVELEAVEVEDARLRLVLVQLFAGLGIVDLHVAVVATRVLGARSEGAGRQDQGARHGRDERAGGNEGSSHVQSSI
ncbi:hypothetical protein AB6O49_13670 [Streptomyces sp. SBR177]